MKKYVLLLLSLLLVSCATTPKVYVDGVPMPHSTYNSINLRTNIRVEVVLAKGQKKKNDNGDFYTDYKFLEVGKSYKSDFSENDVLYYNAKITNPDRHTYQVKNLYITNNKNIVTGGYSGNDAKRNFKLTFGSLKNKEFSIFLIVEKLKENRVNQEVFNINIATFQ